LIQEALLSAEWLNIKLSGDFEYDGGLRDFKINQLIVGDVTLPQFFLVELSKKLPEQLHLEDHVKKLEHDTKVRFQQLKFSENKVSVKGVYNPSK
ncbi:hypothetical protein MJH12_09190, partial [bacterium]|nr:hypothetical protein [bacterium]